jgi:small ligand-binding sensory domain FIST
MNAASALITGNEPLPTLAEHAVREALARTGQRQANSVVLFLSGEFTRHAHSAVLAAARAGQCTQVFGGIAAGLCTESGWALDRPAAAALVLCGPYSLTSGESTMAATATPGHAATDHPIAAPLLCCTSSPFPSEWANSRRFGTHFHGNAGHSAVWQRGRLVEHGCIEAQVMGARIEVALSTGLRSIGTALPVEHVRGYDLLSLGGQPALDSLLRLLPPEWRERHPLPLHLINATIGDAADSACVQAAAVISINADRSVTLTVPLQPGDKLCWAIRQPLAAEAEMRDTLASLTLPTEVAGTRPAPDFGMVFSCIGRGPYFYGDEDRDLAAVVERFPGLPLIGTYGTGQIAFEGNTSRQLQNSVVTALFSEIPHVQPQS